MRSKPRSQTLRQAASLVFALTAILPLLMFAYALLRLNGLRQLESQITLGLALMAALVGFGILRVMVSRMSDLLRAVGQATERGEVPAPARARDLRVPGLGTIQEFHEIAETLWPVWKAEAETYLGRRVLVSVKNAPHPIVGTLVEVTGDGMLLEADGRQVGVSYRRVSAIEADQSPSGLACPEASPSGPNSSKVPAACDRRAGGLK